MRYLFVTWDGGGNLPPELALAEGLVKRGHEVRFLGHRSQEAEVKSAGCGFSPFERAPDCDARRADCALIKDWEAGSPPELFALLRERLFFGPAHAFATDVLAELGRNPADAVATDFMLYGAHAGAERSGLPSAALYHTVYAPPTVEAPPFGPGLGLPESDRDRQQHGAARATASRLWNEGLETFNDARVRIGLPKLRSVFEQFDRLDRVLVMTSRAFDFAAIGDAELPPNVCYVGPQLKLEPNGRGPTGDGRPLVLVSFSTTYQAQQPLLQRVVAALGTLPVRALITTGPALELNGDLPANVEAKSFVPHAEVLPHADLVVTHAGMGTVMASLAHGVPLVCLPMGRDQLDVAARVVHAGAGRRLPPTAGEPEIAGAIRAALIDRQLTANANRLAWAIRGELAAEGAVSELEALASRDSHAAEPAASARPQPRRLIPH